VNDADKESGLPAGLRFQFGANVMLQRPDVAIYLAAISAAWATVEATLADFIEYMISEPRLTATYRSLDPLGMDLFGQFMTLNQRWGVLTAVLASRLTPDEHKRFTKPLKKMRAKLQDVADDRNEMVHAIWGIDTLDEARLIKSKPYRLMQDVVQGFEYVASGDLAKITYAIQNVREQFQQLIAEIKSRRSAP
jgi:hypothetical protein